MLKEFTDLKNKIRNLAFMFLLLMVMVMAAVPQPVMAADGEQTITFNDVVLYEKIKMNLDYREMSYVDAGNNTIVVSGSVLSELKTLYLECGWKNNNEKIVDLTGIEYFTRVEMMYLEGNDIVELGPLSELTQLRVLDLGRNKIVDVTPLSGLVNLERLSFGAGAMLGSSAENPNRISDITPLLNLEKLEYLSLNKCGLSTLPKMYFPNMDTLILSTCGISDVSNINKESFPVLTSLLIGDNDISDISSIGDISTLKRLCIGCNELSDEDLDVIAKLTNLKELHLGRMVCESLSISRSCTGPNNFTDFSVLTTLSNLEQLFIDELGVTSLESLSELAGKVVIEAGHNSITDFAGFETKVVLWYQKYNEDVTFNTYEMKIEIPYVLSRVLNSEDAFYGDVRYFNCKISEDGRYLIFSTAEYKDSFSAVISVTSGKLDDSTFTYKVNGLPGDGMVLFADDNKYHYVVDCVTDTTVNDLFSYEGEWWHMKEGIWLEDTYGFVDHEGGKFFVANGKLHNITGLALYNEEWYFLSEGQLIKDYTGLAMFDNEWFRVENGKFTSDFNGIQEYDGADFLISSGKIRHDYSGLFLKEDGNWCYVANGQIQKQYTGFVQHDNEWFYLVEGVMATGLSGIFQYDGAYFLLGEDGRMIQEYCGLYQNTDDKWYYVANGQVQTQYTGLVKHDGVWFYVENGMLAEDYSGMVEYDGSSFLVENGMLVE